MDVSCFACFEVGWNAACHQHLRETRGCVITRYEVSKVASKVYIASLTPANILSACKRCGSCLLNPNIIGDASIAPSLCFQPQNDTQLHLVLPNLK